MKNNCNYKNISLSAMRRVARSYVISWNCNEDFEDNKKISRIKLNWDFDHYIPNTGNLDETIIDGRTREEINNISLIIQDQGNDDV